MWKPPPRHEWRRRHAVKCKSKSFEHRLKLLKLSLLTVRKPLLMRGGGNCSMAGGVQLSRSGLNVGYPWMFVVAFVVIISSGVSYEMKIDYDTFSTSCKHPTMIHLGTSHCRRRAFRWWLFGSWRERYLNLVVAIGRDARRVSMIACVDDEEQADL